MLFDHATLQPWTWNQFDFLNVELPGADVLSAPIAQSEVMARAMSTIVRFVRMCQAPLCLWKWAV
jgi:hypothetical protein